jgi:excisionase family DNA binding protein
MVAARTDLDNRSVRNCTQQGDRQTRLRRASSLSWSDEQPVRSGPGKAVRSALEKGRRVGQRKGNPSIETASYLRTAEVAGILYVSPKTVSRWAKEGKLPFMKTLGGHRRYPEAKIRELASELREQPTA